MRDRCEICLGCFSPGDCENWESFKHCPCIKCLVKPSCGMSCDDYWEYYDQYCHHNITYWNELKESGHEL